MVTTLPRHMVTESPALTTALAVARSVWPDEPRTSRLIARLAETGADRLMEEQPDAACRARLARAEQDAGAFPYEGGLTRLAELRAEWDD